MNIAALGTGKIIPEAIAAMQISKKFNVVTIWARPHSRDKAQALAEKFHVEKISTDLDEVLNDRAIDFVYVGLVNSVHYEYAKRALDAGKNVILEKPFTVTSEEAQNLIDLATAKKLYLFEAVTNLHMPNFYALRDAVKKIGEIKIIQANYSQYSSRYDAYKEKKVAPAFDLKTYGGALRDLNVYNINLVAALFGMPKKINYTANIGFNGVDTSGVAVLEYDGFVANCICAKDSASPCYFVVQGDKGFVRVDGGSNELNSVEVAIRGEEVQKINLNKFEHRMVHEFIEFGEIFEAGDYEKVVAGLKTSLLVTKIIEQLSGRG